MKQKIVEAMFAMVVVFVMGTAARAVDESAVRIMPLGDSITFGTPNPSYGGYRNLLEKLLAQEGSKVEFVGSQESGVGVLRYPANEGHPGWTINRIKNGIDKQGWLERAQPDIVLLHIGTNNFRLHQAQSVDTDLSALLDDILERLPRANVIVAQIIPFRNGLGRLQRVYDAAIPGIVASKGRRVSVVNLSNVLSPGDYADMFHPSSDGYDKMARVWARAIRPVMNRRTRVSDL